MTQVIKLQLPPELLAEQASPLPEFLLKRLPAEPWLWVAWLCSMYWACALAMLLARVWLPQLNRLTDYSKLGCKTASFIRKKDDSGESDPSSAEPALPAFMGALVRPALGTDLGWMLFYACGVFAAGMSASHAVREARLVSFASEEALSPRRTTADGVVVVDGSGPGLSASYRFLRYRVTLATMLFMFHVLRRLGEACFVHRYSARSLNLFQLAAGLSYYVVAPLSLAASLMPVTATTVQALEPRVAGFVVALYVALSAVQFAAHRALAQLRPAPRRRPDGSEAPVACEYHVPRSALFSWVSSPHYAAEIGLYALFVCLAGGARPALLLLCFVACNLGASAWATHVWYRKHFGRDYPASRRALVPFVL